MVCSFCSSLAEVAQLVEHAPEERGVAGSSPALGTPYIKSPIVGDFMYVILENYSVVVVAVSSPGKNAWSLSK